MRLGRWVFAALVVALSLSIGIDAGARRATRVVSTPAWVTPIDVDFNSTVDPSTARSGTSTLLRDIRIRIGRNTVERYQRTVEKAVSQAGVEALAEALIEFAPDYQELFLHRV